MNVCKQSSKVCDMVVTNYMFHIRLPGVVSTHHQQGSDFAGKAGHVTWLVYNNPVDNSSISYNPG